MSDLDTSKFQTVWTESFNSGAGLLSNAYGPGLDLSTAGQVTLHQDAASNWDSGIMVPAAGASSGNGFGLYSFTMKMDNSAPGTFACLWPSTDVWPGPELDVVEVDFNGQGYSTVHWKGADGSNQYESHALPGVDLTQVHTYSMDWEADHISMYVDGKLMYTQTHHIPQDAAHGGENSSAGVGMQTWWSANLQTGHNYGTVYEVSYAAPVSGGGNATVPVTAPVPTETPAPVPTAPQTGGDAAAPTEVVVTTPDPVVPPVAEGGHAPATLEAGSGADTLVLKVSEQYYAHDAQYTVTVDGQQVGGTFAVSALHGQGADTLTLHGDWGAGQHTVQVNFTNDAYDTAADWSKPVTADLNMFVESATFNGAAVGGAALDLYNGNSANTFTVTGSSTTGGGNQGTPGTGTTVPPATNTGDNGGTEPTTGGSDDAGTPEPVPADEQPVHITGSDRNDAFALDHIHGAVVEDGRGHDTIVLGSDHSDVHFVFGQNDVRHEHIEGFQGASQGGTDVLEFHGFAAGTEVVSLGHGDFKVGHEQFHLDGVLNLSAGDYVFS